MSNRFEGSDGRRLLVEVLESCKLVKNETELAEKLADVGSVVEYTTDEVLMTEGEYDNDIYFILNGEVEVLIKNTRVATRRVGDTIGEMAILDASQPRSATIKALVRTVALKVTEPDFSQLASEHTHIWKSISKETAERLRQRSSLIAAGNTDPILFVGCSTELLPIAEEIQLGLKHTDVNTVIWKDGVFTAGKSVIDDLISAANESDFAVFIFGPDDKVESRETVYNAPRDNTIFELGLFMGKLERARTFVVHEHGSDVKIPTDFLGVTALTYKVRKPGDYTTAMSTVCTELKKIIKDLGTR